MYYIQCGDTLLPYFAMSRFTSTITLKKNTRSVIYHALTVEVVSFL